MRPCFVCYSKGDATKWRINYAVIWIDIGKHVKIFFFVNVFHWSYR